MAKKKAVPEGRIAVNRKARHDYEVQDKYEAGVMLLGWEVKSLRAGRAQMAESHIIIRNNEAWLLNAHITPLNTASTHVVAEPTRTRKLLLHRKELNRLIGQVQQQGFTIIPLALYWHKDKIKLEIALAKGMKKFDKRAALKDRDWQRQKERMFKHKV